MRHHTVDVKLVKDRVGILQKTCQTENNRLHKRETNLAQTGGEYNNLVELTHLF